MTKLRYSQVLRKLMLFFSPSNGERCYHRLKIKIPGSSVTSRSEENTRIHEVNQKCHQKVKPQQLEVFLLSADFLMFCGMSKISLLISQLPAFGGMHFKDLKSMQTARLVQTL